MDFGISPELETLLGRINAFLKDEVYPREAAFLTQPFFSLEKELQAVRKKVQAASLWGPQIPKELGGLGLSLVEHALVSEVLGQSPLGHYLFGCQAPDAGNLEILHRHGTPAQKTAFLMPLVRGDIRSCFAMTEPDSPGSNPTQLITRAEKQGDVYVVNGRKWFTSAADGASFAVVMAVTDPEAPPLATTSFLVEDFTPERVDLNLTLPDGPIDPAKPPLLDARADFLWGAPGADLALEGETRVAMARDVPGRPGFLFGLEDEPFDAGYAGLNSATTGA